MDENPEEEKVVEKKDDIDEVTIFRGVGSWGIVYALTFLLVWTVTNHTSEQIVMWLIIVVTAMWLIKLFEKKISGEHDLQLFKLTGMKK